MMLYLAVHHGTHISSLCALPQGPQHFQADSAALEYAQAHDVQHSGTNVRTHVSRALQRIRD